MRPLALALALVALQGAAPAQAADLDALRAACREQDGLRICSALVPGFDGTRLDATFTTPARRAPRRGRPLIVFLHGLLADKTEYLSDTEEGAGSYKTAHFNNRWFARRGYAVLNYSARGHGASQGDIALSSKHVEVRDTRRLTGLLADARWAGVDPRRVAVLGSSYGGGQAWLLLTTRDDPRLQFGAWRSPAGRRVRLAAVVPQYTWTDLVQVLVPNGRADSRAPLGVAKQTLINGFLATAGGRLPPEVYRWLARVNAGEPYEGDAVIEEARNALAYDRSAYFQDDFFRALRSGRQRRVPVLAAQGWTDPIFPADEALRMVRRLKAADRRYPVALHLGDFEHLTALVKIPDLRAMHDRATRMLDRVLRRRGKRFRYTAHAAVSNCDPQRFGPVLRARTFARLARGRLRLDLAGPQATVSPLAEPRGAALDPVAESTRRGRGCLTTTAGRSPGVASWQVPVERAFTLAGLPRLRIALAGATAGTTLHGRLWDVAPDGTQTLVTRGAYRHAGGALAETELWGNAWRFEAGHAVLLELTQVDAPFLRPSNFPSVATVERVELELPTAEAQR